MELAAHAPLLSALVTIIALIFYFYTVIRVGGARGQYKIAAPAITGHPVFERTYRVQMNTLEHLVIFVPSLWIATTYFARVGWLAPALRVIWIVGRILYMQGYIADPNKRGTGFLIASLAELALMIIAVIGIVMAWSASA